MLTGFHWLPGGEDDPGEPMACATFLDLAPTVGMRSPERLCRPYETGRPEPAHFAQKVSAWHQQGCRVVALNEPNVSQEHFNGDPDDYAAWFHAVKVKVPGSRLYWAGMSPGTPDWRDWYADARVADGIAAHAYGTADQMRGIVEALLPLDKPLWLAEVNFGAGQTVDRDEWAVDHLLPFLDWCSTVPRIEAVTYFAPLWRTPDLRLPTPVDARGTGIETVLRAWTPPVVAPAPQKPPQTSPPERKPMTVNPWAGKLLTVWNLPPDPVELIAAGRALALDGFEIKTADGTSSWVGRRHVTKEYVDTLKAAGFRVLGWSYNYCDGEAAGERDRGDGFPQHEADAAARAVDALGLDGHTFDLEIECEGHADLVTVMLEVARGDIEVPIAAHVWADLAGHADYPAAEILERVDVLRPMIYRPVWNARRCWESWSALFAGDPPVVCPVWGITEGTEADLSIDMAYADQREVPGEAYWEWSAVPELSRGVRALIASRTFAGAPPTEPDEVTRALDGIWHETERLAALEHVDRAVAIQTHVKRLKVALGREPR